MKVFGDYFKRQLYPLDLFSKSKDYPHQFRSDALVGIEIECENAMFTSHIEDKDVMLLYKKAWQVKEDGSLRNHGVEWVTQLGITAGEATSALLLLDAIFKKYLPGVTANARTGVHVHFNFLDKTPEQLGSYIALYSLFEKSLFYFSGGRNKNTFCTPVRHSVTGLPAALRAIVKGGEFNTVFQHCREVPKYSALNLGAMDNFGTVELRQGAGTNRPASIIPWLHVLTQLYEYAAKANFTKLVKQIKDLNTNSTYEELARSVFNDVFFNKVPREIWISDMKQGCSYLKEALVEPEDAAELVVRAPRQGLRPREAPAINWNADDDFTPRYPRTVGTREMSREFAAEVIVYPPLARTAEGLPSPWEMTDRGGIFSLRSVLDGMNRYYLSEVGPNQFQWTANEWQRAQNRRIDTAVAATEATVRPARPRGPRPAPRFLRGNPRGN